ncbi:hypothetical protein STFR1_20280 [Bacillus vallismortis]
MMKDRILLNEAYKPLQKTTSIIWNAPFFTVNSSIRMLHPHFGKCNVD